MHYKHMAKLFNCLNWSKDKGNANITTCCHSCGEYLLSGLSAEKRRKKKWKEMK